MSRTLSDTHPNAEAVLLHLYRETPAWRKWQIAAQLNELGQSLMLQGLRERYAEASEDEIQRLLAEMVLGSELTERVYATGRQVGEIRLNELFVVLGIVVEILERLGIPYFVGGSVASMAHGAQRLTLDADVVADIQGKHVEALVETLSDHFYTDSDMIYDAIKYRSSLNFIHYQTMLKIDIFIPQQRAFEAHQFQRRMLRPLEVGNGERIEVFVASPEDIILAKLEWYRKGNEVSDRQWIDLMSVVKTQRQRLDVNYMKQMAAEIGVADLLERALAE
jgi:hypothetical protein